MALVWNMASIPPESVKRSLLSSPVLFLSSLSLSVTSPSQWNVGRSVSTFLTHRGEDETLLSDVNKMKLHARINDTLIFRLTGPLRQDTTHAHTNTCTALYCFPSLRRQTLAWALYLTMSVRWNSYRVQSNPTERQTGSQKHRQTQMNPDGEKKPQIRQLNIYSQVVTTLRHWSTTLEHTGGANKALEDCCKLPRDVQLSQAGWVQLSKPLQACLLICLKTDEVTLWDADSDLDSQIWPFSKEFKYTATKFLWHTH